MVNDDFAKYNIILKTVTNDTFVRIQCLKSFIGWMCVFVTRRKPTNRKLWDRTTDRWEHDMYREEEQGPKTKEEKEVERGSV